MIYLDNAATSYPKPDGVYSEVLNCMMNYGANPGRGSYKMAIKAAEKIYECRENIAALLKIPDPLNICFTLNTSDSLNLAIKGILKPHDHVVISDLEHNSVYKPLKRLEKTINVSITVCPAEEILNKIKPNTKLVVLTHASNVTGQINDIDTIGRELRKQKIIFVVDAAQTIGAFNINIENIDVLAFPGHKALLGPFGIGGIFLRSPFLSTLKEGGTGSFSAISEPPDVLPDKYEVGTLNTPAIFGLNKGVQFVLRNGVSKIHKQEKLIENIFLSELKNMNGVEIVGKKEISVPTVSIRISNKDSNEVCEMLDRYNICARSGLHCSYLAHNKLKTLSTGLLRFSIGVFNTKKDIIKTVDALHRIIKN